MYKKIPAIMINCLFGLCLAYDIMVKELAKIFVTTDTDSLIGFFFFNVVWIALFLVYNSKRYKVTKGGNMYWITLLAAFLPWSIIVALLFYFES